MSDEQYRNDTPSVTIGSSAGGSLTISVVGRMHPEAIDFDDGNWLLSPVEVVVGHFSACIPASLRADELRAFRTGLSEVYENFGGIARLQSMEGWLSLAATVHSSGRVEIDGEVIDSIGSRNKLIFRLDGIDQSYLPGIIDSLLSIENEFPVRGEEQRLRRLREQKPR
ncbi:WapI family immunity protein [Amycolatopsis granulosa]|uniref:WapI family immunity protein n=1 Tax=Amycolatopsis granulosa TaxID=185684 RepID=UPI001ABA3BB8|nr:hypothetical protein [Amycolatopsis granulosa]NIH83798.1 hypothetical protein [Amycolatopsis granulosa]